MRKHDVFGKFVSLGAELDLFMEDARRQLPPDRLKVLERNVEKMIKTAERFGVQLAHFLALYDRLSQPPRGPATVHRLAHYSKRRKKRP